MERKKIYNSNSTEHVDDRPITEELLEEMYDFLKCNEQKTNYSKGSLSFDDF